MDIFHHTRFQFPVLTFFLNLRAIHLQLLDYFGFLHTMELPMKFDPCIQPSIDYMDSHLLEELDLEDVARQSGYSLSSFYRFFQALTGFTLKEYIRNRRLAYAARQLVFTRRRILDIALDAGFHSQEVFHRAFVSLHGIPPGEYRRTRKASVEQLDRMDAFARRLEENHHRSMPQIPVRADIIRRGWVHLAGLEIQTTVAENIDTLCISRFWQESFLPRLAEIPHRLVPNMLAAYEVTDPRDDTLLHFACVEVDSPQPLPGFCMRSLEPGYYAAFTPRRPLNPLEYVVLVQFAYGEWFPMSGCEIRAPFTMDLYIDQPTRDGRSTIPQMTVLVPIHPPPPARQDGSLPPYAASLTGVVHRPD